MKIDRKDIFREIIGNATTDYSSVVLTCFSFDPIFFSNFYLPRLRQIGISNVVVFIDAGQYQEAAEEYNRQIASSGIEVGFSPIQQFCSSTGVFHSKVSLFVGPKKCLALIGSGNLTYGGLSYNDEVWNAFCADGPDSLEAPIVNAVWQYLNGLLSHDTPQLIRMQFSWMLEYSDCLTNISKLDSTSISDQDSEDFYFIANRKGLPILDQLKAIIQDEEVAKLSIVSPFFDRSGTGLCSIIDKFRPKKIICYTDKTTVVMPIEISPSYLANISFHEVKSDDKGIRTHAKIFQFETTTGTFILTGSANATSSALGSNGMYGNDEACILVHSRKGRDYIKDMGISAGAEIDLKSESLPRQKSLKDYSIKYDILLKSCELREYVYYFSVKGTTDDVDLVATTVYGTKLIHFDSFNGALEILYDDIPAALCFQLFRNNNPVSNCVIVTSEKEVADGCPDPSRRKLDALMTMDVGHNWDSNLVKILSFVNFVSEDNDIKGPAKHSGIKTDNNTSSKTISSDRFDDTFYAGEKNVNLVNSRILDYYSTFAFKRDSTDDSVLESDEDISQDNLENGNTANQNEDAPSIKKSSRKKMDEIQCYLDRLYYRYYGRLCSEFDKYEKEDRLTKFDVRRPVSVQEYSSVLIAIALLFQLSKDNSLEDDEDVEVDIKRQLILILGRFLMIFRKEPVSTNEFSLRKMDEMRKNVFVYSLLLISHFEWNYNDIGYVSTLILNILDMLGIDDLNAFKTEYEKTSEKGILSVNNESQALIDVLFNKYLLFKADFDLYKVSVDGLRSGIAYKVKYGFFMFKGIQKRNEKFSVPYILTASAPGFHEFDEHIVENGNLIVAIEIKK